MAKPKTPAQQIEHALAEIDRLDQERQAISEEKSGVISALCAALGLNRKALTTFLTRRKLDEDQRFDFDTSLHQLAEAANIPFQADLFEDEPPIAETQQAEARLQ